MTATADRWHLVTGEYREELERQKKAFLKERADSTDLTIVVQRMALRVKLANSGFVDPATLN